jgi:uncharacterized protein YjbJ (UPF0337 family)
MKNQDEIRGKMDQAKGRVKQGVGDLTGNERLRNEGLDDEAAGKVDEGVGKARRKVGETVSKIGDKIGR